MHRLLKRQIKKHVSRDQQVPAELEKFVRAVDEAYASYDSDRAMLERSLELSSGELVEANRELREQKRELESSLKQVREMKDQMVIQEKMASLGSLTAGIAHEIKNPLNFINNFADLSKELIEEVNELLEPGAELDREELDETLGLLTENLQKIAHHGSRADSIVKGMLLHSRGKAGTRVETDVNALVEEYLNLAYHGMRAKDTTFNVGLEREYAEDLPMIPMVPQDVSRVFLNIISNACYAANKKRETSAGDYKPTVTVTTRLADDRVEVLIADNGIGIPKDIMDKVFNPFFTTKPPNEGTGLGLSITYDIVVEGHGGTLDMESVEGEGTTFSIKLPMRMPGITG